MEIDVTTLATEVDLPEFSGSVAERGVNAGPETWANSLEEATERPILTDDQLPEWRDYVRGFGAWEDEEIDGWSPAECNALFIQFIAGDLREARALCPGDGPAGIDWPAYQALAAAGTCSGNVFLGDDGKVYASISE